jgi:hypothetical protein
VRVDRRADTMPCHGATELCEDCCVETARVDLAAHLLTGIHAGVAGTEPSGGAGICAAGLARRQAS